MCQEIFHEEERGKKVCRCVYGIFISIILCSRGFCTSCHTSLSTFYSWLQQYSLSELNCFTLESYFNEKNQAVAQRNQIDFDWFLLVSTTHATSNWWLNMWNEYFINSMEVINSSVY